jgi:hypothetical protein
LTRMETGTCLLSVVVPPNVSFISGDAFP